MKLIIIFLTIGILSFGQSSDNIIGEKIEGNFLGKEKKIVATAVKAKEEKGNPLENGTPDAYEIRFSDIKLKPIKTGCCEMILINEGDLNNDKSDDISIYQAPMNGCTYSMTTYSFINGSWKQIVEPFLIPTGCNGVSLEELQKRIFRENNRIYFYESVSDNANERFVKKKKLVK